MTEISSEVASDIREWRERVLMRDGYTCCRCGAQEGLHAHHTERRHARPDLSLVLANGETLCADCHADEHEGEFAPAIVEALRGFRRLRPRRVISTRRDPPPDSEFGGLLRKAGMSRTELSRRLGLHLNTVSNWGGNPPQYAVAYLELYARVCRVLEE